MIVQRAVHFAGRVQGVGFRYTTQRLATNYEIKGYVQNLADGRVLLVAQGESAEIDRLVTEVQRELGQHIRSVESLSQPNLERFSGFSIRR